MVQEPIVPCESGLEGVDTYKAFGANILNFNGQFAQGETMTLTYKIYDEPTNSMKDFTFVADVSGVSNATDLATRLADAVNLVNVDSASFTGASQDKALRGLVADGMGDAFVYGFRASDKYNLAPVLSNILYTGASQSVTFELVSDEERYQGSSTPFATFDSGATGDGGFTSFTAQEMSILSPLEEQAKITRGTINEPLATPNTFSLVGTAAVDTVVYDATLDVSKKYVYGTGTKAAEDALHAVISCNSHSSLIYLASR